MSRGRRQPAGSFCENREDRDLRMHAWEGKKERVHGLSGAVARARAQTCLEELRSVFQRLAMMMAKDLECRLLLLGEMVAERRAVRLLGLWPAGSLDEIEGRAQGAGGGANEEALLECDEGLEALGRGEMDALVYARTSVSNSELARLFSRKGCTSAIVVPVMRWTSEKTQGRADTSQAGRRERTQEIEGTGGEMYFLAAGLAVPPQLMGETVRRLLAALGGPDTKGLAEREARAA